MSGRIRRITKSISAGHTHPARRSSQMGGMIQGYPWGSRPLHLYVRSRSRETSGLGHCVMPGEIHRQNIQTGRDARADSAANGLLRENLTGRPDGSTALIRVCLCVCLSSRSGKRETHHPTNQSGREEMFQIQGAGVSGGVSLMMLWIFLVYGCVGTRNI